jgi:hypothetical protein
MRDRAWRRYKHEVKTIKRLKTHKGTRWWFRGFLDVNGINHIQPKVSDLIATEYHFDAKTLSTPLWVTKDKYKYSSNRQRGYWRSGKGPYREKDVREFLKILKENGLK